MRNYICKKENPFALPHNLYMQMLYLIRDYEAGKTQNIKEIAQGRANQWEAVENVLTQCTARYNEEHQENVSPDLMRAFFDYPYFSCIHLSKRRTEGASKRSWSLYRNRLAYLVAKELSLYED